VPSGEAFVRDVPVLRFGRARGVPGSPAGATARRGLAVLVWGGCVAAAWLLTAGALYGAWRAVAAVTALLPPS